MLVLSLNKYIKKSDFLTKLSRNKKLKNILNILCTIFLVATFAISISLESIVPFNHVAIACFAVFIACSVVYVALYGAFIIDFFIILIVTFLLLQYVSLIVNLIPYYTRTPTLMCFLSFFIYQYVMQLKNKKKLISIICLSSLLLLLLFTIKYFRNILHPNFSNAIGSYFGNTNDVARHLSFAFLSMLILCKNSKKIYLKLGFLCIALYALYLVVLTCSISNTLTDLICLSFFGFILLPKKKKWIFAIVFPACIAIIIGIINLPVMSAFKTRIINMISSFFNASTQGKDTSSEGRFYGALNGFKLFLQNPIFGNGYRSVYRNYYIMSHNNIAEILSDFGLLALVIEELIICVPLFKKQKNHPIEILMFNTYILLFQFFLVSYNSKVESIILPLMFGLSNCKFNLFSFFSDYKEKRLANESN